MNLSYIWYLMFGAGFTGYHVRHNDWGGPPDLWKGRARGGGHGHTAALTSQIWGGQCWNPAYCCFIHGVAGELMSSLGSISVPNGRSHDRSGKTSWCKTYQDQQNLAELLCHVCLGGGRTRGPGGLHNGAALQGVLIQDRGGYSRDEASVTT